MNLTMKREIWKVQNLPHAKETIYTPDGQKDEAGNRIVKYEKDALVARMVTDKEGKAVLNNPSYRKILCSGEKAVRTVCLTRKQKNLNCI